MNENTKLADQNQTLQQTLVNFKIQAVNDKTEMLAKIADLHDKFLTLSAPQTLNSNPNSNKFTKSTPLPLRVDLLKQAVSQSKNSKDPPGTATAKINNLPPSKLSNCQISPISQNTQKLILQNDKNLKKLEDMNLVVRSKTKESADTVSTDNLLNTSDREYQNISYYEKETDQNQSFLLETQETQKKSAKLAKKAQKSGKNSPENTPQKKGASAGTKTGKNEELVVSIDLVTQEVSQASNKTDLDASVVNSIKHSVFPDDRQADSDAESEMEDTTSKFSKFAKNMENWESLTKEEEKAGKLAAELKPDAKNQPTSINLEPEQEPKEAKKKRIFDVSTSNSTANDKTADQLFPEIRVYSSSNLLEIPEVQKISHIIKIVNDVEQANLILFEDTYMKDPNEHATCPSGNDSEFFDEDSDIKYGLNSLSALYFLARIKNILCVSIDYLHHIVKNFLSNDLSQNEIYQSIESFIIYGDKNNGDHHWAETAFRRSPFYLAATISGNNSTTDFVKVVF